MNILEIEKRRIALARARIEKEIKLGLTSRLASLEKRLASHEKVLDERISDLRKLLKQRMEEFNGCIDLIVEEGKGLRIHWRCSSQKLIEICERIL